MIAQYLFKAPLRLRLSAPVARPHGPRAPAVVANVFVATQR